MDTRVRNRFPPPSSLKQFKDVQEVWYKIFLETVQNMYGSTPRTAAVLEAKGGPTP
jgi:hypothetical protein